MSSSRYLMAATLTGVLLTGCGSSASTYPAATAAALQERVAEVVTAANSAASSGDFSATRTALTQLRADAAAAQRLDRLSPERAATILSLVGAVEAGLPTPAPAPAPVPVPVPATQAPSPPSPTPSRITRPASPNNDKGKREGKDENDRGRGNG